MSDVNVKITDLTLATELDGTESFECVQGGLSRQAKSNQFPLLSYGYIMLNDQPELTNARFLAAGAGIVLTDGGPGDSLTISGNGGAAQPVFWTTYQSVTLAAGDTNNLVLSANVVVLRVTPNAAGSNLTGIDSTLNTGRMIVILNVGATGDLTLPNQSGSSLAENTFKNVGNFDVIVPSGGSARYWQDPVSLIWRSV